MSTGFKGKKAKDIEAPYETLLTDTGFATNVADNGKSAGKLSITSQLNGIWSFDGEIEKRK